MNPEVSIGGFKVLIVDDDPLVLDCVAKLLKFKGGEILSASTAEDALVLLSTKPGIEVVVADIVMPGMSGLEMLSSMRQSGSSVPFILITGYQSLESAIEGLRLGSDDYLIKPGDMGPRLVHSVLRAVSRYRLFLSNKALQEDNQYRKERYSAIYECSGDALFLYRIDTDGTLGDLIEVNESACALLRDDKAGLFAKGIGPFMDPDLREAFDGAVAALRKERSAELAGRINVGDGILIPAEIHLRAFSFQGDRHLLVAIRSILDRLQIEQKIAEAVEQERHKWSRDLHDVVCQKFSSIQMMAALTSKHLAADFSSDLPNVELIADMARQGIIDTKRLMNDLFPVELEVLSLEDAVSHLAANYEKVSEVKIEFHRPAKPLPVERTVAVHVYRIVQEGLSNAVRHGKPKRVEIRLAIRRGKMKLSIHDDGHGLHVENGGTRGFGLQTMRYRAHLIGGDFEIHSGKKKGTTLVCTWR